MRRRRWRSYIQVCCFLLLGLLLIPSEVYAQLPKKSQIVVFVPEGGLFLVTPDDKKVRHLTRDLGLQATDPTWSPDGKKIAFTGYDRNFRNGDIYTLDADGSHLQNLTKTPHQSELEPAWSPSGEWIAFRTFPGNDLVVMKPDGSFKKNLTNGTSRVAWSPPSWSRDSQQLAFCAIDQVHLDLFLINVDGTGLKRLLPKPPGDNRPIQFDPAWSPSGRFLAFVSVGRDGPENSEIYLLEFSSGELHRLTNFEEYDRYPSWLPDGSGLLFVSRRDPSAIWYMRPDGRDQKPLWKFWPGSTAWQPRIWFPLYEAVFPQGKFWTTWGNLKAR